jgi:hypothetical protein
MLKINGIMGLHDNTLNWGADLLSCLTDLSQVRWFFFLVLLNHILSNFVGGRGGGSNILFTSREPRTKQV